VPQAGLHRLVAAPSGLAAQVDASCLDAPLLDHIFEERYRTNTEKGPSMLFLHSLRNLNLRSPAPSMKPTTYYVPVVHGDRTCPECAGPLSKASGCVTCVYCGWGKCG
jgi:hypothetical protein